MVYRVVCIRLDMKSIYWKSCCFDVIILNLISSNLQVISFCGFWLLLCYLQKSPRKWSLVDNDISIATSKTVVCFVFFPIVSNENAYQPEEFDSHHERHHWGLNQHRLNFCAMAPFLCKWLKNVGLVFINFFRGLVAVVECYLHNYFDRSLSGALADQVGKHCFSHFFFTCLSIFFFPGGEVLLCSAPVFDKQQ